MQFAIQLSQGLRSKLVKKLLNGIYVGIPNLGDINVTIPDWKTKELRRAYYASISFSDHQLGLVLDKLKEMDLEEDTIVVFWV